MKLAHPTYQQLLKNIPKIQKYFDVEFLDLPGEKLKLVKFSKNISANAPLLMIMAGCHGEEPAPPLAIFKNYKLISETAKKYRVNLVLYPLVNPWGFSRNKRFNRENLSCNSNWIHQDGNNIAKEIGVIVDDLKKYKPIIFTSMHEDSETGKSFYIYPFGNRKYEKSLIKAGKKHFPVLKDGPFGDLEIKNGAVYNHHDGTAEDFMFHRGCEFSCCTETPLLQPLAKRIKCNTDWILELIKIWK